MSFAIVCGHCEYAARRALCQVFRGVPEERHRVWSRRRMSVAPSAVVQEESGFTFTVRRMTG